ncbi:TonB C-terminal domain-containing protein [Altericroceibacterium endophyticum]|uniref:Energy transducer TonB n=1 Tax=Altericroceibacterium endophyticum TaxID=1808508 RepID=A0A6I4T702_9SPHN|nr:TonB C-terminal domain-containing protein [Altericroceibacterium endophyticum]MXO66944.1 energy transducer TonB [Altericroceibacterium endophyticum]
MAVFAHLSSEERLGLGVALAAHIALVGVLMLQDTDRQPIPEPNRMSVSFADQVSLESTAPDASATPQASIAPELSDQPEPMPVVEQPPEIVERTVPQPVPRPVERPPEPKPQPKPSAKPSPKPVAKPEPKPKPQPAKREPSGGSRIGDDFLAGTSSGERDGAGSPADNFGPAQQASLGQAITRQLKPHWTAPQGPDAELLVTIVRFRLNRDGSLAGTPEIVRQSGVNATNETQKSRHAEQAIRAIRLAAPFNLPDQFYDKWKVITSQFDRRL